MGACVIAEACRAGNPSCEARSAYIHHGAWGEGGYHRLSSAAIGRQMPRFALQGRLS